MADKMAELGKPSFWAPPEDATPEQRAEAEAFVAKMLVPDEAITTRIDVSDVREAKWRALKQHVTQMADDNPFIQFGLDGWPEFWAWENYILRESRVESAIPETDLFAGLG
jgi:mycothiol S-conjugate amidase